jgi:succinyl-CoA synthetase beta subunit
MNIHEYQGKEILASYGVRIQRGIVAIMQLKLLLLQNN